MSCSSSPAFPCNRAELPPTPGMTFRQYAAVMAMQGLLAKGDEYDVSESAVWHADRLIQVLEKEQK